MPSMMAIPAMLNRTRKYENLADSAIPKMLRIISRAVVAAVAEPMRRGAFSWGMKYPKYPIAARAEIAVVTT